MNPAGRCAWWMRRRESTHPEISAKGRHTRLTAPPRKVRSATRGSSVRPSVPIALFAIEGAGSPGSSLSQSVLALEAIQVPAILACGWRHLLLPGVLCWDSLRKDASHDG